VCRRRLGARQLQPRVDGSRYGGRKQPRRREQNPQSLIALYTPGDCAARRAGHPLASLLEVRREQAGRHVISCRLLSLD
jgi:hypothetical protein